MFEIAIPRNYGNGLDWIISIIFNQIFGLEYKLKKSETADYSISLDLKKIQVNDVFFKEAKDKWLDSSTLPGENLLQWDVSSSNIEVELTDSKIPVLYGRPEIFWDETGNCQLGLDIFGSAFFMLSRYEEAVLGDRDNHDRFPAFASSAYKNNFLKRPVIDEYLKILWNVMKKIWPSIQKKRLEPGVEVTCDVDKPYSPYVRSLSQTLIKMSGDVVKRKSIKQALLSGLNRYNTQKQKYHVDENHTFDWIMDVNEKEGNKVVFYFIVDHSEPRMDGVYSIDEPRIRKLINRISDRGHEIGLHGSYGTYKTPEQTLFEVKRLRRVMEEENIHQDHIGNRQHYLRWSTSHTPQSLEKAGIEYDTTLGYAEIPGFRCGTCFEYPMYNLTENLPMRLKQRPLILMETTVMEKEYLGLGTTEKSLDYMLEIKKQTQIVNGKFMVLWHNSSLISALDRKHYTEVIKN